MSHTIAGPAAIALAAFVLILGRFVTSRVDMLARYSIRDLIELAGTQGPELVQWLVMRGALGPAVRKLESNYHVPISNTGSGLLLLEKAA